ncbi:MAG TPA: LemA family protein [Methylibium sp.]|uniref:LemA family protein n=1 Tax=Methylibium sp. TaxID=2067992 RepID=UPI002DB80A72|nr:LemA family protein [Methylibium sp.]HEU4458710.1 LemA family protein [Methylibium sp.]
MSTTSLWLVALGALLGFWCLGAHNRLVRLRHAIGQAWLGVDAQLQRRHALAHELAERLALPEAQPALGDELARSAVELLAAAVRQAEAAAALARPRAASAGAIQSLVLAEQVLDNALRPLAVLIAARARRLQRAGLYAALHELHRREPEIETQAAFARRVFNDAVAAFNAAIDELPTRLLAGPMRFAPAASFQTAGAEVAQLAWPAPDALGPASRPAQLALPVVEPAKAPAVGAAPHPAPADPTQPMPAHPFGADTAPAQWPASTIEFPPDALALAAAPAASDTAAPR